MSNLDEIAKLEQLVRSLRKQLKKSQAKRRKLLERVVGLQAKLDVATGSGGPPVALTD